MNFKKLTLPEGRGPVWVNLERVNCIVPTPNGTFLELECQKYDEVGTPVMGASGTFVIETPEEILGTPKTN
jgi:hypothetical protein